MAEAATIMPKSACLPACPMIVGADQRDIVVLDRIGDQVAACPDWNPCIDDTGEPRRPSPGEMFAYCLGRMRQTRAAHEVALAAFNAERKASPMTLTSESAVWRALSCSFRDRLDATERFAALAVSTAAEMVLKREAIDAAWVRTCQGEAFELMAEMLHEEWQTFEAEAVSLEAEWNRRALETVEA